MEDNIDSEGYIDELSQENKALRGKLSQVETSMSALGSATKNENLITYQIENAELLDKLEHFYKGEYIGTLANGDTGWVKPKDAGQIPLNEFGVSAMMEIVSKYIDKNTTLSYYSEMRIYEVLADLGDELNLYVLCNYEKMGMSDKYRKTKFRLLIVTSLHMIESTYRKAIGGETMRKINESTIITQSDFVGQRPFPQMQQKKKFSLFNPRSWG